MASSEFIVERARPDLDRFYALLGELGERLGGPRWLSECHGRMSWPSRGVYFFFESGEFRINSSLPRVVRVGTHALTSRSRTTLWQRLAQHRGTVTPLGGNHRGSIFRFHVGDALIRSGRAPIPDPGTWGKGSSAKREILEREHALEAAVCAVIGIMPFLWLNIDDQPGPDSLRGYIERNSIGLLSNLYEGKGADLPSSDWLGLHCSREVARRSGLWNVRHVDGGYEPRFLDVLGELIRAQSSVRL